MPIAQRLGVIRLEPIVVTIGATVLSDTLSLVVFAVCVSMYTTGFSPEGPAIQLTEIAIFVPLILIGLSRAGAWALSRMGSDEEAHFLLMLAVMAVAGAIADFINLPGIVGAGTGGQQRGTGRPGEDQAGVLWQSLVHPELLYRHRSGDRSGGVRRRRRRPFPSGLGDRRGFARGKVDRRGGWGCIFGYAPAARSTMWALTLPQVAATLAAAVVAFDTRNGTGQRMLDGTMLNAVLVLMLAILGPVLTERFAPGMLEGAERDTRQTSA